MDEKRIQFTKDELCHWAGMGDYQLVSPDGKYVATLRYEGEPPHGDSYHLALIDGRSYPGYVWGCMFAFSACSRYLAFSAMPKKFERRTAVLDLHKQRHFLLPSYIHQCTLEWPSIIGNGSISNGQRFTFQGHESWLAY